ncbi:MAG TPA: PRC-barrel domain-containing protein [Candidatus Krumholzibacteria bacterium]|nr:PRC-barrel domain-containing protein [Candidatus Krumholzibacteria bacterium]
MLRSTQELKNYNLIADDGQIGRCKDFLFDDAHWTIRYMVADTGRWVPGRKVLVPPQALGKADWDSRLFKVKLTREQIKSGPGIDTDAPVSREREQELALHFGWEPYWIRTGLPGAAPFPAQLAGAGEEIASTATAVEKEHPSAGNLRSVEEVTGYHIEASDGEIGHVEEFIVDDETWALRYVVVDTRNVFPGKKVLIAPKWVSSINWPGQRMALDLTKDRIRNAPVYSPGAPVNRELETRLYDYYGRPAYWL